MLIEGSRCSSNFDFLSFHFENFCTQCCLSDLRFIEILSLCNSFVSILRQKSCAPINVIHLMKYQSVSIPVWLFLLTGTCRIGHPELQRELYARNFDTLPGWNCQQITCSSSGMYLLALNYISVCFGHIVIMGSKHANISCSYF